MPKPAVTLTTVTQINGLKGRGVYRHSAIGDDLCIEVHRQRRGILVLPLPTGPCTKAGKAKVARNAWKGDVRPQLRAMARALRHQNSHLAEIQG